MSLAGGIGCRHTSATIQLECHVKLPLAESRCIGCRQQTFVFVGQRLFLKYAIVRRLHIRATVGGCQCESLEEGVGGLKLIGMGITFAIKVGEVDCMRIGVEVNEQLVDEVGVVVLRIQFQRLFRDGYLQGGTDTVVPCFLLIQVLVDHNLPSTGQQEVVLGQHMVGAVALADGAS